MKHGFSLLELSIVLVIIGLLAGGVMTGQALIRAAEFRSIITDYQRFNTAINAFRDKYQATAGDFKNATAFWGKDNTNCTANSGTAATPGTCNGNGNGMIELGSAAGGNAEIFQFWKQLALAGVIEGNYSGLSGSGGLEHCVPGTNCPSSKMANVAWIANSYPNAPGDAQMFALDYGNYLGVGLVTSNWMPLYTAFNGAEAWGIDSKLDDGKPYYGKVIARYWDNYCTAPNSGTATKTNKDASYRLSESGQICALYFINAF